jgi:predicted O-methyltransferase YrrM
MASEPRTGALLRALAASKPGGRFLELGTGTGLATAWILSGMDGASQLTSVDTDARVQGVAREFLGSDARLSLVLSDGLEFLKGAGPESFDFVFADAMPGKYEGLDECLRTVRRGGFYVIDDMLPQENWPEGHAAKIPVLLDALARNEEFAMVPMEWSSGIVVAARR